MAVEAILHFGEGESAKLHSWECNMYCSFTASKPRVISASSVLTLPAIARVCFELGFGLVVMLDTACCSCYSCCSCYVCYSGWWLNAVPGTQINQVGNFTPVAPVAPVAAATSAAASAADGASPNTIVASELYEL